MPCIAAFAAAIALTAPAVASGNRTGLPLYPSISGYAPDYDAATKCHEYAAMSNDPYATIVSWYRQRFHGAKIKITDNAWGGNNTALIIGPSREVIGFTTPKMNVKSTSIKIYGGTTCPEY
ncbi:MAG: hypothetical protein GIW94_12335 [Candidatus Eremiobacteraeota bacterium]|nr:hypothetical protein [Candidatus Eremiobacteraeota bacterium]